MKARISAMMDGELTEAEFAELVRAAKAEGEALEAWREYHLVSDAMRDTCILSAGFSARFCARLEAEPAILAPGGGTAHAAGLRPRHGLAIAAGLAAVAAVGTITFQLMAPTENPVAQATAPVSISRAEAPLVPVPREADDYLRAHQNYSPRNGLQGVAPYVRTVADTARKK